MSLVSSTRQSESSISIDQPHAVTSNVWLLGFALVALVVLLCMSSNSANDLFWQLRTGRDIVNNHAVPRYDHYSWTRIGTPWVVHEWLSFIVFWEVYCHWNGFGGIWLLECLIVTTTFIFLFMFLSRQYKFSPFLSFGQAAGGAVVAANFFQPRPQIFTYFFLMLLMCVLTRAQRNQHSARILWATVMLFIVWSNLHSGALIGVALIFLYVLGNTLELIVGNNSDQGRTEILSNLRFFLGLAGVCLFATFLTPYGWREHANFFATLDNGPALKMVGEWQTPTIHDSDGQRFAVFCTIAVLGLIFTKHRRYSSEVIIILVVSYEALMYLRNLPLFAIVVSVLSYPHVASATEELWINLTSDKEKSRTSRSAFPFWALVTLGICLMLMSRAVKSLTGYRGGILANAAGHAYMLASFPNRACRFMEDEQFPVSMHLMNDYNNGGYLVWRLPQYAVYIDGRADLYSSDFLADYFRLGVGDDWRKPLDDYRVDVIMTTSDRLIVVRLANAPDWMLVYKDPPASNGRSTVIYIRRSKETEDLIRKCIADEKRLGGI